jgi:hypothetical protein
MHWQLLCWVRLWHNSEVWLWHSKGGGHQHISMPAVTCIPIQSLLSPAVPVLMQAIAGRKCGTQTY